MTELFEVISKEEFQSSTDMGGPVEAGGGTGGVFLADDLPDLPLIWCDFCKGHYNEYHFGDIDEPSR